MVRLTDLHAAGRDALEALDCPSFHDEPWVDPKPLNKRKVALISSAGLIRRGDKPFKGGDAGYRTFPSTLLNEDIVLSHISVNFDRTMATRDIEAIFPRQMLRDMADAGEIGSASSTHYSFMGATDPEKMEAEAKGLSGWLKADSVDTVVLLPV